MANVTFRAASTNTATHNGVAGTSLVVNKPTGTVQGDWMIFTVECYNVTLTDFFTLTGTGWVTIFNGDGYEAVFIKIAGASEPSSYTVSLPSTQTVYDISAGIVSYSNVGSWSVSDYQYNGGTGLTSPTLPNMTVPLTSQDMAIGLYMEYQNSHTQGTLTAPAGSTQRVNVKSTHTSGANTGIVMVERLAVQNTGNATSSVAIEGFWDCYLLALYANLPPTANAGTDQAVFMGSNVTLSGSGADPEGGTLTYAWTVTSAGGTGLTTGSLTGATTTTPSFTAPTVVSPANVTLTLTITDQQGLTGTDTVVVTINPLTVLISVTGAGGVLIGGAATVSSTLINVVLSVTGAGGLTWGGEAVYEFVKVTVQAVEVFRTIPTFEVSLAARTPAASGAPALAEIDRLVVDSIQYTDELNRPGSATLGVPIGSLSEAVKVRLSDLAAHPCEVRIYYDSELQWAGEVQTIAIQDQTIQLGCVGLLGYVYRMGIVNDWEFTATDQTEIVKTLVDDWQDQSYGHFGIDTSDVADSGVTVDMSYLRSDLNNVGSRLEDLCGANDGFDMHVDPETRVLVLSYPHRGIDRSETTVLDERSIDSASVAVSIGPDDLISDAYVNGTSQGASGESVAIYSEATNTGLFATYGRTWGSTTIDGVVDQDSLNSHAIEFTAARSGQLLQPGATLFARPGTSPGDFSPGDTVAYAFDAGLGLQSGNYRVASVSVQVDGSGALRLAVEFT